MNGVRRASTEWRSLIDAEYGLNFDGGGGSVYKDGRVEGWFMQVAEKTYADYKLVATNRGGHSSTPRPDNAIYALAGALKAIEAHRFEPMINDATRGDFAHTAANDGGQYAELVKQFLADPKDREAADLLESIAPGSTRTRCVATMLSGGHAPNALPQRAEANVNCRIFPGVSIEAVRGQLQALAGPDVQVAVDRGFDHAPNRAVTAAPGRNRRVARRGRHPFSECAGRAVPVVGRDRRLLSPRGRHPGLRCRRNVEHCRPEDRRPRA